MFLVKNQENFVKSANIPLISEKSYESKESSSNCADVMHLYALNEPRTST